MATRESEHYPRLSPFRAGLTCKCPRCGRGPLYSGFLTVAEHCPVCGLDLQEVDSGDGPAVFIIFILGFLVLPMALLFEAKVEPPMWLHVAIWPALILGSALGLLRPVKGVLIALQHRNKASDSGTLDYD